MTKKIESNTEKKKRKCLFKTRQKKKGQKKIPFQRIHPEL